jgi:pimeloyl-ACP methyl ester carboxylesterase
MATFVLVHGGWHGGWCWRKVTPLLQEAGHTVYTPTLTGLGERSHLANREIGLVTHIHDLIQVVEFEDLSDLILVGHSYSGMVITGAAERLASRIKRLVYLDAFVPADNQAVFDILPPLKEAFEQSAQTNGEGWQVPPFPLERWGITDPTDVAWVSARVRPQSLLTFTEKVYLVSPEAKNLPRSYIRCTQFPSFENTANQAKAAGWDYHEINSGHDAMVTHQKELTQIFLRLPAPKEAV